jgi:GST-like protein
MHKLFSNPGWGSAIVEAQLAWYGIAHETLDVGDLFTSEAAREALAKFNPVAHVPTLVMPDGSVMTESAAITLLLADGAGDNSLVPPAGDRDRQAFLRWLVFLVANIYPTFTFADVPARFVPDEAAQAGFAETVDACRKRLWAMVEAAASAPWFLGERFSALDIFVAVMTRWLPRRPWFAEHSPRLHAIALAAGSLPALAEIWRRNYPDG